MTRARGRGLGTCMSGSSPGGPSALWILASSDGGFRGFCGAGRRAAAPRRVPRALVPGSRPRSPPPCGPSQAGPQGGDSAEPRPPGFEVCTCFQNLTTFLPRRTPFWSVTLKATKLLSPPWTLVPTANNLLPPPGIRFSCYGI